MVLPCSMELPASGIDNTSAKSIISAIVCCIVVCCGDPGHSRRQYNIRVDGLVLLAPECWGIVVLRVAVLADMQTVISAMVLTGIITRIPLRFQANVSLYELSSRASLRRFTIG